MWARTSSEWSVHRWLGVALACCAGTGCRDGSTSESTSESKAAPGESPGGARAATAPGASAGAPPVFDAATRALGESLPTAAALLAPRFDVLDCDRSGYVDEGQVDEHFSQLFRPLDADRSRSLTLGEWLRPFAESARAGQRAAFALADASGDGLLSVSEFRTLWLGALRRLDRNGDREVTRAELAVARASSEGDAAASAGSAAGASAANPLASRPATAASPR